MKFQYSAHSNISRPSKISTCSFLFIILPVLMAGLFINPVPVTAASGTPWFPKMGEAMGGVVFVISLNDKNIETGPPYLNKLKFYPCPEKDCIDHPLEMVFTGPNEIRKKNRLCYIALSLPAGSFRLAGLEGEFVRGNSRISFNIPLSYVFRVRENRTAYLGRLNVDIRPKAIYKPNDHIILYSVNVSNFFNRYTPDLGFDHQISDEMRKDTANAFIKMPDKTLLKIEKSLMTTQ